MAAPSGLVTVTSRLPTASTAARSPGSITVVAVELLDDGRARRCARRAAAPRAGRPACRASRRRTRPARAPTARLTRRRARAGSDQRGEVDRRPPADHRGVQVDQHGADLRQLDAEAREVGAPRSSCCSSARRRRGRGRRHGSMWRLAPELHVGAVQERASPRSRTAPRASSSRRRARRPARRGCAATSAASSAVERLVERVDEVVPQVGDEAAQRIGDAGPRRHQQPRDAELARQRHGMQRAGAAEGEQREVARIVAARQRHHADGARHVVVGERRMAAAAASRRQGPAACRSFARRCARTCVERRPGRRHASRLLGIRAGRAAGWRR